MFTRAIRGAQQLDVLGGFSEVLRFSIEQRHEAGGAWKNRSGEPAQLFTTQPPR